MSTDLLAVAREKVELQVTRSGDLRAPCYSRYAAMILLAEKCHSRDYVFISVGDWAKTMIGTSNATTREMAKGQISRFVRLMSDDPGWLIVSDYDIQGRLIGLIYVRRIPEEDDDGVFEIIMDRINTSERRSEVNSHRAEMMREKLEKAKRPPAE